MKSILKAIFCALVEAHQDRPKQKTTVYEAASNLKDGQWYPSSDLIDWYYDKNRKLSVGESFLVASLGRLPEPYKDDVLRFVCEKHYPEHVDRWSTRWDSPRVEPSRRYHDDEGPSARCS